MRGAKFQRGMGQIVPLVAFAVILAVGYVAIDLYSGGQKEVTMVEARGVQMIAALSAFKRDQGAYPDALDKLLPKYALAVAKCPGGAPMGYSASGGEYRLSCTQVVFKYFPYNYDSRSKSWNG